VRVETKQLLRDDLLDDLADLLDNKQFCAEMYEQTRRQGYLNLIELINYKINKRKDQLGDMLNGQFTLDQ
jgi:hypothetical protein